MRFSPHAMTLRQVQYVVAVAEHASFRKAAVACHVSQPSLSAQVAQVEEALGVQLFERDNRSVRPTHAGELLLPRLQSLLTHADDVVDTARQLSDPLSGTLRLGIIPTMGPYLLPHLAPVLRKQFPRLTVTWREEKTAILNTQLAQGLLDGAVVALEGELTNVEHMVMGRDALVFAAAASHPLAQGKGSLKLDALDGTQVLLLDDGHCFREQALEICSRTGAQEPGFRATSLSTLVQMAASGGAVTLLPAMAVDVENRQRDLAVRTLGPREPYRTVALVWRAGSAMGPTLRSVGKTLKEAYAAHVAGLCLVPTPGAKKG